MVVGCNGCLGSSDFRVARLNPDGTTYESFGNGGEVDTDFDARDTPFAVAIQSDSRIVVAGWAESANSTESDFAVVRYGRIVLADAAKEAAPTTSCSRATS